MSLPSNSIILISGVPGSGKTSISYALLNAYEEIRLVEETDIIREVLLGYNDYLLESERSRIADIYKSDVLMSYEMAASQCHIMKNSLNYIIKRQQRKGIPTIINGVHIIPEVLYSFLKFENLFYITLYLSEEDELYMHLKGRNPKKYACNNIPFLYRMNYSLFERTERLSMKHSNVITMNTGDLSLENTVSNLKNRIDDFYNINTSE